MKTIVSATAIALLAGTAAFAQQPAQAPRTAPPPAASVQVTTPGSAVTISNYYKQNVYDSSGKKIGEVADVLIDGQGRVTALILSVGGFLGIGEKNVAVPFQAVRRTQKDNSWQLVMNATADALKNAPAYKFDKNTTTWVSDKS